MTEPDKFFQGGLIVGSPIHAGDAIGVDRDGHVVSVERICTFCWGSHGCDLPVGHDGIHQCGPDVFEVGQVDPHPDISSAAHSRYDEAAGVTISGLWGDDDEFLGWGEPWPFAAIGYL